MTEYTKHSEHNFTFKFPSAILVECASEEDACRINDVLWTLATLDGLDSKVQVPYRTSKVNMNESDIAIAPFV